MEREKVNGLKLEEVEALRNKYGLNELVKEKKSNPVLKFLSVFKEPMFLLLLGAALIYFILGEPKEACIMLIFVTFVSGITFVQEWKTERTINSLKEFTSPKVEVLRNGNIETLKTSELVPGDIIYLHEGERIPADCEVLEVSNFSVDESILTGEGENVFKITIYENNLKEGEVEEAKTEDYWREDYIYAGTLALFGKCTARVVKTGFYTEYGKISKAISETKEEYTPLQRKVHHLVKNLAIVGFFLCLAVIILSYFYNHNLIQSILSGITLAMGIIPEEFPVVLTVFLSLGAFRLAKKNTLVRRVSAVETLGSTTVLAVDKTGTITNNIMTVRKVFTNNTIEESNDFRDKALGKLMIMSCEMVPYDSMEKAIVSVGKGSLYKQEIQEEIYELELIKKISFDSKTKRMANIFKLEENKYYVASKGSPETILPLCGLNEDEKNKILKAVDKMAEKGLRVIAFAHAATEQIKDNLDDYALNFGGLVGLQDSPKHGVKEAIKLCKKAGIRVVMITGDYSKTAMAIGEEIGLKFKNCAITGEEIDSLKDEELCERVKHCDIFSRVIPEHKMKIIKALKKNGEIVAMTGDGVNDAPALKSADIGIAMGKRGTEVAKEAAHMILMDDDFTTIVNSVEDGRRIFDNIRKAMVYIMVVHIPIIALALFSPIFNLPQILLPVHIVLLELIIDPTCSIVFEREEPEKNIMDQKPRSPKAPLLTKNMTIKVLLQGITMFLSAFLPFHFMVDAGVNIDLARSFSLMTLIISNVTLVVVNRSNTEYAFNIFNGIRNITSLLINSIAIVMVFAIVYIPIMQDVCRTKPLDGKMLIVSVGLGMLSALWWEVIKLYQNTKIKSYSDKTKI